jgi:putative addiction module antidote
VKIEESIMTKPLKIRRIGKSLGLVLPKALLGELGVGEGDQLYVVKTSDGVLLTVHDSETLKVLENARDFMRRHAGATKKLAEG